MVRADRLFENKKRLEEERANLLAELGHLSVVGSESMGYRNHMADDATEAFEQTKNLSLRRNLERLLKQVEDALHRFEQGTYGLCEDCGVEIDTARLKALPYVTLCIKCSQLRERASR